MLEIHPQLLLYQGAIFLLFAFLMWRFVYRNLVKMVEDRRQRIENTIVETERKLGEAEALRRGYEGRVSEISARADEVLRQAETDGWRKREELVEAGRSEAARIAERGRLQCELEREEALLKAKTEMLDIASELARKSIERALTPEVEDRLARELSAEIRRTEWKD